MHHHCGFAMGSYRLCIFTAVLQLDFIEYALSQGFCTGSSHSLLSKRFAAIKKSHFRRRFIEEGHGKQNLAFNSIQVKKFMLSIGFYKTKKERRKRFKK